MERMPYYLFSMSINMNEVHRKVGDIYVAAQFYINSNQNVKVVAKQINPEGIKDDI